MPDMGRGVNAFKNQLLAFIDCNQLGVIAINEY